MRQNNKLKPLLLATASILFFVPQTSSARVVSRALPSVEIHLEVIQSVRQSRMNEAEAAQAKTKKILETTTGRQIIAQPAPVEPEITVPQQVITLTQPLPKELPIEEEIIMQPVAPEVSPEVNNEVRAAYVDSPMPEVIEPSQALVAGIYRNEDAVATADSAVTSEQSLLPWQEEEAVFEPQQPQMMQDSPAPVLDEAVMERIVASNQQNVSNRSEVVQVDENLQNKPFDTLAADTQPVQDEAAMSAMPWQKREAASVDDSAVESKFPGEVKMSEVLATESQEERIEKAPELIIADPVIQPLQVAERSEKKEKLITPPLMKSKTREVEKTKPYVENNAALEGASAGGAKAAMPYQSAPEEPDSINDFVPRSEESDDSQRNLSDEKPRIAQVESVVSPELLREEESRSLSEDETLVATPQPEVTMIEEAELAQRFEEPESITPEEEFPKLEPVEPPSFEVEDEPEGMLAWLEEDSVTEAKVEKEAALPVPEVPEQVEEKIADENIEALSEAETSFLGHFEADANQGTVRESAEAEKEVVDVAKVEPEVSQMPEEPAMGAELLKEGEVLDVPETIEMPVDEAPDFAEEDEFLSPVPPSVEDDENGVEAMAIMDSAVGLTPEPLLEETAVVAKTTAESAAEEGSWLPSITGAVKNMLADGEQKSPAPAPSAKKALPSMALLKGEKPLAKDGEAMELASLPAELPVNGMPDASASGEVRLSYAQDATAIPTGEVPKLQVLSRLAVDDDKRVMIASYASGTEEESKAANMVSLSRGLALRAFFIDQGVAMDKIVVQAKGLDNAGGPPDRVDITLD